MKLFKRNIAYGMDAHNYFEVVDGDITFRRTSWRMGGFPLRVMRRIDLSTKKWQVLPTADISTPDRSHSFHSKETTLALNKEFDYNAVDVEVGEG